MNLEKITKLLPLGGVILIGLGVLKTSVYYNYFGVDIMSYLTTSEVLTLFMNDYHNILLILILGFFHYDISDRVYQFSVEKTGFDIISFIIKKIKWVFFSICFIVVFYSSYILYYDNHEINTFFIYFYCFMLFNTLYYLFLPKDENKEMTKKLFNSLQLFCVVLIVPLLSLKDIRKVNHHKNYQVTLYSNNKIKNSTNQLTFLGKAGKYYIYSNLKEKKTIILKEENIDLIRIKL